MNNMKLRTIFGVMIVSLSFFGCKDGGVKEFFFPIEKDLALGQQLSDYIDQNPAEFDIVDSAKNVQLYKAMYDFRDVILNSGKVRYKDEFAWQVKVIDNDTTLNAFAAPGGFIYIYTGIIQFLDSEDHFAGVMGHELAHADRRHSINQMIKSNGVQVLLDIALGSDSQLGQIASGLAGLKFSRSDETDADAWSVEYLCGSEYESNGAAGFFQKLIDLDAAGTTPQFLSTHPSPDNRVEDINTKADDLGCMTEGETSSWTAIQELSKNIVK